MTNVLMRNTTMLKGKPMIPARVLLVLLSLLWFAVPAPAQNPPSLAATVNFWKDPEFVKGFMGGYGFNSDNQPPVSPEEAKLLQNVAGQLGTNPGSAITTLKAAINPNSSPVLSFALGTIYLQEQNFAEAEVNLKKAIAAFPNYLRAHQNLGIVYVQQSKFELLIGELTKTLELGGEKGAVYGLLGYAYMNLNRLLPAEVAYSKALLFEPDKVEWKAGYAECLRLQNKDRESIAAFGELIRGEPEEAKYWVGQAYSYSSLGENPKAAQNYEIVRRMGKADSQVLNWLGTYYINERMFEQARTAFVEAFKADSKKDPEGLLRSADALLVYGSPAEAETLLNSVKSEAAAVMTEQQKLQTLRLTAQIQLNSGRDAEAVKTLEQVLKGDPTDGKSILLLANYHARHAGGNKEPVGDQETARANEHLAKALFYLELAANRADPDGKQKEIKQNALIAWAQLLVNRGEYAKALPLLRQSQQLEAKENVARYLTQLEQLVRNTQ